MTRFGCWIDGVVECRHAGVSTASAGRRSAGRLPVRGHRRRGTTALLRQAPRGATADDIVRATQTVGAHDFILPPRGRLRDAAGRARPPASRWGSVDFVAFARLLLADPRILILDEATSSVDIGTERRIEQALRVLLARQD